MSKDTGSLFRESEIVEIGKPADQPTKWEIRPAGPDEFLALRALMRETIQQVNFLDYTPAQVAAWVPSEDAAGEWLNRLEAQLVLVATNHSQRGGFATLADSNWIDLFYVAANCQRRGVGRQLLQAIEQAAIERGQRCLESAVSITARLFFESHGYQVMSQQTVQVDGQTFQNFRMRKELSTAAGRVD